MRKVIACRVPVPIHGAVALQIRRKHEVRLPPADDDVSTRLGECHARIRRFLEEAAALARTVDAGVDRQGSAAAVQRYFAEALPLHTEDEDRSIVPRLGGPLAPALVRLAAEHASILEALVEIELDWARWAAGATDTPTQAHVDLLARLTSSLLTHLAAEETELFPAIAKLSAGQRRLIVAEMAARRSPPPPH